MTITGIKCDVCDDIVYSRTRHDFRWCTCGNCAIDGGQRDYIKVAGDNFKFIDIELDVTLQDLYDDWNNSKDEYGIIKGTKNEA